MCDNQNVKDLKEQAKGKMHRRQVQVTEFKANCLPNSAMETVVDQEKAEGNRSLRPQDMLLNERWAQGWVMDPRD